jgi:hypothetical protein
MALLFPSGAFADPNLRIDPMSIEERGSIRIADVYRAGRETPVFFIAWDAEKVSNRISPAETDEQTVFVSSARRAGVKLHSVPNGGLRDTKTAVQMKREGMTPGVPDLIVWGQAGREVLPPCALEFKRANGGLSDFRPEQLEWLEYIHTQTQGIGVGVLGYKAGLEMLRKIGYAV